MGLKDPFQTFKSFYTYSTYYKNHQNEVPPPNTDIVICCAYGLWCTSSFNGRCTQSQSPPYHGRRCSNGKRRVYDSTEIGTTVPQPETRFGTGMAASAPQNK